MRVFVAGHRGMVGSAVCRLLSKQPGIEVLTGQRADYAREDETHGVFQRHIEQDHGDVHIDALVMAAAHVGGIDDNQRYGHLYLEQNLAIQKNLFKAAALFEIPRVIFLGSVCAYPREADVPIHEEQLHTGPLEPTNQPYAIAKLAGIEQVRCARKFHPLWTTLMPSNLYGPGDNFSPTSGHALPALLNRLRMQKAGELAGLLEQKFFDVWGEPNTVREWTHVDDLAWAILKTLNAESLPDYLYNVGSGEATSMQGLLETLQRVAGTDYETRYNGTRVGAPNRQLNSERFKAQVGWQPALSLYDGIYQTYDWLCAQSERNVRS
jgi:GDP-L-fucose synthase